MQAMHSPRLLDGASLGGLQRWPGSPLPPLQHVCLSRHSRAFLIYLPERQEESACGDPFRDNCEATPQGVRWHPSNLIDRLRARPKRQVRQLRQTSFLPPAQAGTGARTELQRTEHRPSLPTDSPIFSPSPSSTDISTTPHTRSPPPPLLSSAVRPRERASQPSLASATTRPTASFRRACTVLPYFESHTRPCLPIGAIVRPAIASIRIYLRFPSGLPHPAADGQHHLTDLPSTLRTHLRALSRPQRYTSHYSR